MDDGAISLTAGFQAADEAAWRALVEKTLNGASFEKRLMSKTYDGIDILPLYTAANAAQPQIEQLRTRHPFDEDRAWDIRAIVDHPSSTEANLSALADLQGGATSLLVKIDPTGREGVAIADRTDLEGALEGVLFDLAPIALDAGYLGPLAAQWLNDIAQSKTLRPHLHLHLNPITVFARSGSSPGPIAAHVTAAAQAARRIDSKTAFLASGQAAHEAGGTDAQEIALMAAEGLAYIKAMIDAGADMADAVASIALGLAADADYFATIAKFRAARAVWARVTSALTAPPGSAHLEARASRRMLSVLDPWVNMLRLTSAAFGASVGGADAIVLEPFTQPLGRPTPFARRQARNIQLVLMEEAHLGRVADPAGGAWFMETLSDQTARAAWSLFQAIEQQGGVVAALSSGFIAKKVKEARDARAADVAKRRAGIVGVSEFPNLTDAAVEIDEVDPAEFAKPSPLAPPDGPDDVASPLAPWRTALGFEALRDRAKAMVPPPTAILATLGAPKDYTARVGFARNALAAAGVSSEVQDAQVAALSAPIAVICGSDAGYNDHGVALARALRAHGAKLVYLAGRPGDLESNFKDAGVDGFIFAGVDIETTLATLLNALESGAQT